MGGNGASESLLINPAGISLSTSQLIEINYFNKYLLNELSSVSILYACSSVPFPFAVNVSTFGYNKYRETMFRFSLSKQLSSRFILGISSQYSLLQTELYSEECMKVSTDVGILFIPVENMLIGLSITDLPYVRLDDKSINIEDFNYYYVQGGFNWQFINNMLIAVSTSYNNYTHIRFETGIEYIAYESFFIRGGIQTNPLTPAFGVGLKFSTIRLDVAVNHHSLLGISSGVGLTYSF